MPKIETLVFRVADPVAQRRFYCEKLGMRDYDNGDIGYGGEEAKIRFIQADAPYAPKPDDVYWKIALSVPDIDVACEQLTNKGIAVSSPIQFQDVGYLAKFNDPEGFTIELLDHWFKGERRDEPIDPDALGGGAHLSLITLRTADMAPVERACQDCGMTPLSVQPVDGYGFTLYFYAFTTEIPPSADLSAVENRPWVYQRKYTVLEVQHVHSLEAIRAPQNGSAGYAGTHVSAMADPIQNDDLMIYGESD